MKYLILILSISMSALGEDPPDPFDKNRIKAPDKVTDKEVVAVFDALKLKTTTEETCAEAIRNIETFLHYYGYHETPKPSNFKKEDDWSSFIYLGISQDGDGEIRARNKDSSAIKIKLGDYVPSSRIISVKEEFMVYLHHVAGSGHGYQCKFKYAENISKSGDTHSQGRLNNEPL